MTELEELRIAYAECSRQRNELLAKHKLAAQEKADPVAVGKRRGFIRGWDSRGRAHKLEASVTTDDYMRKLLEIYYPRAAPQPAPSTNTAEPVNIEKIIDEYIEDYEMHGESGDGRDAYYMPTADDKALLKDAFMGFDFSAVVAAPSTSPAMTDAQAMDLLPTNTSMSRTDALLWVLRATERQHKIGVKP